MAAYAPPPEAAASSELAAHKVVTTAAHGGVVAAADVRLTDARSPLAHGHVIADTTGLQTGLDGKVGTADARLTDARAPTVHGHPQADVTGLAADLAARQATTQKNAAGGYAGLDAGAKLASSQIPALAKADVGLGLVDNTADAAKAVSTAQQVALDAKQDAATAATDAELAAHATNVANPHAVTKSQVALGVVDNTADAAKPVSTAQQTALDAKAASSALTTLQTTVLRMARASQFVPSRFGAAAYYYGSSLAQGTRTGGRTLDQFLLGAPYYALDDVTIGRVDVNVSTGVLLATFRPGIYIVGDPDNPWQFSTTATWATLTAALNPIDCTTAGLKTLTPAAPVVIPAGNWFALGGAPQGALATLFLEAANLPSGPWGNANSAGGMSGTGGIALQHNASVAGALPTAFVPTASAGIVGAGLGFTRTA